MNSFNLQLNSLVFKILVLLLLRMLLNTTEIKAQQKIDSVYIKSLYDSAIHCYRGADYKLAIQYFDKLLLVKKGSEKDIKPEYFKIYNWLGIIHKKNGDLKKAIEYYESALGSTSDNFMYSLISDNIANVSTLKGDYSKAILYFEKNVIVLEKSSDKDKFKYIADNYHNRGYAYFKMKENKLALTNYLKSIKILQVNNLKINGDAYYGCALAYIEIDSIERAGEYFEKAIECFKKDYGEDYYMTAMAYMNYAGYYSKLNNFSKSEQLYKKAYKILLNTLGESHPYTSLCLKDYGLLYYQSSNYSQALHYFQKSLMSKIKEFNDSSIYSNPDADVFPDLDLLDVLKAKALAFEKLAGQENKTTNLNAALSALELTVNFIEQLRTGYLYENSKLQLAEKEHETYLSIIRIAYELFKITNDVSFAETAFKYSEYSKYATLRELKNDELARTVAGVPDSISTKEREIKENIGSYRIQVEEESKLSNPDQSKIEKYNELIFSLNGDLDSLMQELENNYPAYYKQKYKNDVMEIGQLQKEIDEDKVVLEYVLGDGVLYIFAIGKDSFGFLNQPADSSFYSNLELYATALQSDHSTSYFTYRDAAYNLYKKLIQPVESLLENKKLLLIPDDKLSFISFESLVDSPGKPNDKADYRNESYLLRKYPMVYAFSATLYVNSLRDVSSSWTHFLGIAPGYENSKDSLRHIPLGLENVRKLAWLTFGKSLSGEKATEKNFRKYAGKYNVIHFYAHGLEDTLNPANSRLYLSNSVDSTEDNYLYAWEICNMQLDAKLMVLASCYSGSGKFSKGEGVLSISRSFIYAGSKSVIMSLWAASHKPSNEILNNFYWNLFKGMHKDEAMQLAKLKYLEESNPILAHPRFWAGIIVNGNEEPVFKYWYLKRIILIVAILGLFFFVIRKRKLIRKLF